MRRHKLSGRLQLALEGNAPGYSCNYFRLDDTLLSIEDALRWTLRVATTNGAPSLDFSSLRPNGSPISRGGTSPGVVPFMHAVDAVLASARRNHNKNHAGLIGLDYGHADFWDFMEARFKIASKVVYFNPDTKLEDIDVARLVEYYKKQPKLFFHKRTVDTDGNLRGTNLCTEILMPHKGTCVLSSFNIAGYTKDTIKDFPEEFTEALLELVSADAKIKKNIPSFIATSADDNNQVGLSVCGMATLLGQWGLTYGDFFNSELSTWFDRAYRMAKVVATEKYPQYNRFFCQAPLVHSHLQHSDPITGLSISPSLEPVEGVRVGDNVFVSIISETSGNRMYTHPGTSITIHDTTADEWLRFCDEYNSRYIDQSISFSWFDRDEQFSVSDFTNWYSSSLESLYYYVPVVNVDSDLVDLKFVGHELEIPALYHLSEVLDNSCGCFG